MKLKTFRFAPLAAVLLAAVFLHGCGYRAEAAPLASNAPAAAETTPAPTETPVFTVEYRLGDDVLKTESIPFDGSPCPRVCISSHGRMRLAGAPIRQHRSKRTRYITLWRGRCSTPARRFSSPTNTVCSARRA